MGKKKLTPSQLRRIARRQQERLLQLPTPSVRQTVRPSETVTTVHPSNTAQEIIAAMQASNGSPDIHILPNVNRVLVNSTLTYIQANCPFASAVATLNPDTTSRIEIQVISTIQTARSFGNPFLFSSPTSIRPSAPSLSTRIRCRTSGRHAVI